MRLRHGAAEVGIDLARGGRIASLVVDGLSLLVEHDPDPLDWGCYVMAPYAGRVRHARFTFLGREHVLRANARPHALHGTVFDRAWEQVDEDTIRTTLGPDWPFAGSVEQRFDLGDDGLRVAVRVEADDEPFPASIGWHPWFRRRLGRGRELELDVRPVAAYVVDDERIPTGEVGPVPEPPWDTPFPFLHAAPRLVWPGALTVEVTSSCTTWVVFSERDHAVCVEPQTARPDALSTDEVDVVTPERPLTAWMRIAWGHTHAH